MNPKSRITSILSSSILDTSITGLPTFDLTLLNTDGGFDFSLPTNLRLGHLAERIVGELIKTSANYNVLYENVQLSEGKRTIGEIDFIIEAVETGRVIHMELAYKFYLYDPSISDDHICNWIGPNRNDSLVEKLEKLKSKQFPLLFHPCAASEFGDVEIGAVSQELCLIASLFVPYQYKGEFVPAYKQAIKGYYLNYETFVKLDNPNKSYCFPTKTKWGMDPSQNEIWTDLHSQEPFMVSVLHEKQALLCWQKEGDVYSTFFIVWW